MVRILSTGTAFDIATITGDAGQLGMAAEFDGYFSGLIGDLVDRLMYLLCGEALGDFDRTDLSAGVALGGDRRWEDRFLWFKPFPRLWGYLAQSDRTSQRYRRPLSQHSVSQH